LPRSLQLHDALLRHAEFFHLHDHTFLLDFQDSNVPQFVTSSYPKGLDGSSPLLAWPGTKRSHGEVGVRRVDDSDQLNLLEPGTGFISTQQGSKRISTLIPRIKEHLSLEHQVHGVWRLERGNRRRVFLGP
jgi:hypothetical protein